MMMHHILGIIVFFVTLATETCASEICVILMIAEISNPFLQYRYLMRKSSFKNTCYYAINDVLFVLVFSLCRMILMPMMLWWYFSNPAADYFVFLIGMGLYVISWVWWVMIVKFVLYKYVKSKSS